MASDGGAVIGLWLLYEDEVEAWAATQTPLHRRWIGEQAFKGERHRVVVLPDAHGGIEAALGGLGKRQGALSLWHAAGIAERLPARRYILRQSFSTDEATQISLGFAYAAYRFERYKRLKPERCASLESPEGADRAYVEAAAESLAMARDWINTPAADFGPAELAAAAKALAQRHSASYAEWVGEDLLRGNFPAIHAVGRASAAAPRLVELRWPARTDAALPKLVLVGKGVCFDSGGLDLKTSSGMALMKKDMGGAAIVLGLANLLIAGRIRADLRVLIPAVENSIGGNAYRPGDVLATRKGLSVEVGNTDAEGRLVLCDALALADAERPDLIIDIATLTGAARVALGPELPALFGSDDQVVADLARAAAAEHDPLWPMPLWSPYDDELGSKIADLNNVSPSGLAGAIFGALFLRRFVTESARWVHLDVYAWNPKDRPGRSVGAEASGLRGVYRYLMARYGSAR
ncbi:MAG: leucyl aminopeptidase family protein [Steroidobacteraceae bacterium]|jgi:leucyl aminopeptidase